MQIFAKKRGERGFTLIELLVVIAIIGILASIVLVSLGGARGKARDAQRQADLRAVVTAQEMCYDDSACGSGSESYLTSGAELGTTTLPAIGTYMSADADYVWVNNGYAITGCSVGEFFCAYAAIESSAGTWFAASEKGAQEVSEVPAYAASDCSCW